MRELNWLQRSFSTGLALVIAVASFSPYYAEAWNKDREWLEQQLQGTATSPDEEIDPNSYLGKVNNRARAKWDKNKDNEADPGSASLTTTGGLKDRKYWQGDLLMLNPLQDSLNYFSDMITNFTADFGGCVAPDIDIDLGFDIDVDLELWWPVYQVHTHPIFQNRYGNIFEIIETLLAAFGVTVSPSPASFLEFYPALYALDAHAWSPYVAPAGAVPFVIPPVGAYSNFQYLLQPMMMGHAKFNMQHDLVTKWGPLAAALAAAGHDASWIIPDLPQYTALSSYPIPGPPTAAQRDLRYNPLNPYNLEFSELTNSKLADTDIDELKLDHFGSLLGGAKSPVSGPGLPKCSSDPDDWDCRELRYTTAPVSGRHPLEYSVLPTLFTLIWRFIPVLSTALAILPSKCRPPEKIAYPYDSDRFEMFYYTRDPFLSKYTFLNDKDFQQDYDRWLENPKACTEYKMTNHPSYANIPYDQFDSKIPLPLLPDIQLPDLLNPMSTGEASRFNRMCSPKVGGNVPFSIHNSPQGVEILAALTNIEKASRLSYAHFKEFIELNPEFSWLYTFRMIDERRDKIQFTYHDGVPNKCIRFGDWGELFSGGNAMVKKGDYGLYSATVWQRHTCDISLGRMVLIMATIWSLLPLIAGLVIFS